MNYRHGFHAGNFADVLKHLILMRIINHLLLKPAPFRVIDTHAGAGLYDLMGDEAARTDEWREGFGRLDRPFAPEIEALLLPYRKAVAERSAGGRFYPGSPLLIRHALRSQDRASFNEAHPPTFAALQREIPARDTRLALTAIDGYMAWKAQIPPIERRGLVLVDPPFEERDEFSRLEAGLTLMARKWPTGSLAIWYPLKALHPVDSLHRRAIEAGFSNILVAEMAVARIAAEGPLGGTGMLLCNPPYTLGQELERALPAITERLARTDAGQYRVEWLRQS
jgi:23S rRNA (adenine2030-N6)-methyltransferase